MFLSRSNVDNPEQVEQIADIEGASGDGLAFDHEGNLYFVGTYSEKIQVETAAGIQDLLPAGSSDILFGKFDARGNLLWLKTWGGPLADHVSDVVCDIRGDVYVIGQAVIGADLDPGIGEDVLSNHTSFITKFNADGEYLWALHLGPNPTSITTDAAGDFYLTGYSYGEIDLDPGPGETRIIEDDQEYQESKGCICRFNSEGILQWGHYWNTGFLAGNETGVENCATCCAVDGEGFVYVCGYCTVPVEFDESPIPDLVEDHTVSSNSMTYGSLPPGMPASFFKNRDDLLVKFDPEGNIVWVRIWGGEGTDAASAVAVDNSSGVYVGGNFQDEVDFNPGTGSDTHISNVKIETNGSSTTLSSIWDAFLSKFDSNGNFEWVDVWGGPEADEVYSISLDDAGRIYTTGQGSYEYFFRAYSPDGELLAE
jgi:hypothetical protein